jgi:hypothetical protein
VPDNKLVQSVKVMVNLTHTFDGDLIITLVPPAGAPITLSHRHGGSGQNFTGTTFDDAAATAISTAAAPFRAHSARTRRSRPLPASSPPERGSCAWSTPRAWTSERSMIGR